MGEDRGEVKRHTRGVRPDHFRRSAGVDGDRNAADGLPNFVDVSNVEERVVLLANGGRYRSKRRGLGLDRRPNCERSSRFPGFTTTCATI
jgi:hypothetical protein